jgi:hypothetical protein
MTRGIEPEKCNIDGFIKSKHEPIAADRFSAAEMSTIKRCSCIAYHYWADLCGRGSTENACATKHCKRAN